MASDATGETGDMFMYGGMTSDATVPSQTARVLCVDATTSGGAPPANMFEWFAVASGEQEKGVMPLTSTVSPKHLQRSTLTGYGDDTRALLFGGDDGTTVQSGTWILTRTSFEAATQTLSSWSWNEHVANVGETTPSARTGHAAVAFPDQQGEEGRTVVMVFGGQGQGGAAIDDGASTFLFSTDTATWHAATRADVDQAPQAREGHTMVYMSEDHAVYLFGGW